MSQTWPSEKLGRDVAVSAPGGEALRSAYAAVRRQTESLSAPLSPEDQTAQSMPDASPVKWHRAHTTWFFETFVLGPHAPRYAAYDADYEYLFNSYYNAVGAQYPRPERGLLTRPGAAEVGRYRGYVDAAMDALLAQPLSPEVAALVELGLHHEQQHQELLLTDVKHLLGHNPQDPAYASPPSHETTSVPAPQFVEHAGGMVEIGATGPGFAFDNEGPRHRVWLAPYALADRLVTAGEYRQFIEAGGYDRLDLWLDAGVQWLRQQGVRAPLYWRREADGSFSRFTLYGRRPVRDEEPVSHLSYFEADAYARWVGARLPTEAEWEYAAPVPTDQASRALEPSPTQGDGFFGAVWQWTRSDYAPYPGFAPAAGAVGEYNGKFMCGQYVLRGSSCVTAHAHARRTYRNFFPPTARWQYAGLRLAQDAQD